MTPRTWTLLEQVAAHLAGIRVDAGFRTDAGLHVTLEPAQIRDDAQLAMAVALETVAGAEMPALRTVGVLVRFGIYAKVKAGFSDAQHNLHALIADITERMADRQALLPLLPQGTQFPTFAEAQVIPPAEGMQWIGAVVRYSAHITNR